VALVIAMFAAFVPELSLSKLLDGVWQESLTEALRDEERCRNDLFEVVPTHSWEAGKPIDMVEWNKQFSASDAEAEPMVQKQLKGEKHRITEFTVAGTICRAAICVAMVSLVVIAFKNF
jgi:hypothetical protein